MLASRFTRHLPDSRRTLRFALVGQVFRTRSGSILDRDGFQLQSLEEEASGAAFRPDVGEIVRADFFAAADRATSPIARALGLCESLSMGAAVDL